MYLVIDPDSGYYIFSTEDPRRDGCELPVEDSVQLLKNAPPRSWDPGDMQRDHVYLGRSPVNPREYRIFNSAHACQLAEYQPLGEKFQTVENWKQFVMPQPPF